MTMVIEINGLTPEQEIAIEDMMQMWMFLGVTNRSRWVSFYADGRENFKPEITVNGRIPQSFSNYGKMTIKKYFNTFWKDNKYLIDFNKIVEIIEKGKNEPKNLDPLTNTKFSVGNNGEGITEIANQFSQQKLSEH